MSDIPSDLIREFLVRVPLKDLVRFKCVCKSWKQLIDDAAFIKSNLTRQMGGNNLIIFSNKHKYSSNIYSFPLTSLYSHSKWETKSKKVTLKELPRARFPIPSCDGLVLESIGERWALSNLLTRESHMLPWYDSVFDGRRKGFWNSGGLGYDVVANDYKVAISFCDLRNSISSIIYSLKSNNWHIIEQCPYSTCLAGLDHHGVFVKGAIHWITCTKQGWRRKVEGIIALDLSTEKYRQLSLPPFSNQIKYKYYLSALNDCLIFSHGYDAWILNDCGVQETWTKLLSLQYAFDDQTRLLAYDKGKEQVLIQYMNEGFLWYHLQTGCMKKFTITSLQMSFSSQIIPLTLIRLNGNKRKATSDRLGKRPKTIKLEISDFSDQPES